MSVPFIARRPAARVLSGTAVLAAAALLLGLTSLSARAGSEPGPGAVRLGPGPRADRKIPARSPWELPPRLRRAVTAAAAQKKAVIVVGPVEESTPTYTDLAEDIANAAEAWGMEVVRIYPPNATWDRVVSEANGADLFVYLGHGNGWPSPYPPFQEDTKNGVGLNRYAGEPYPYRVKYYGADWIRRSIRFAPNAVVLLGHACYTDGNGEPGSPIPTVDVARERVDNFAAGFLASGARVVFAFGWQPGRSLVDSLFSTTPMTMDSFFMTGFGGAQNGSYEPYYGWVGWQPDLYFDSVRTPGARNHLDPDPASGYLRAVTGDLEFTTSEWLGGPDAWDLDAPVLSELSGNQPANTIPAGEAPLPVFTPNGDRLSERIRIRHSVSEGAFLKVEIRRSDDTAVRTFTTWSEAGPGSFSWDGRDDDGGLVADGRYEVTVTPRDRAGNVGSTRRLVVKVLTAMRSPTASPSMIHPGDGDALAQVASLGVTLTRDASLTWRITTADGSVVRHGMVDQGLPAGAAGWDFDGRADDGSPLADGTYVSLVTATTADGTYSHRVPIRVAPYALKAALTVTAGTSQTITLLTAEPVSGWPRIVVRQPGMAAYRLVPVRSSATRFTARWVARPGAPGAIVITVTATDTGGGVETRRFQGEMR